MTLVERQRELQALLDAAAAAGQGAGRLVLVAGEAGVGKSALVEALESQLTEARWLTGACDGQFTPRPLGPLLDIATQTGGELAERCRTDAPRTELFASLLDTLRGRRLTVLVIEDLHWADEATLDLLRFVGRRLPTMTCLVVATYRNDALSTEDPLQLALGDLSVQRATERIDVRPLSADAVRELAEGSGLDPVRLHELTGGNAFFLTELLAAGSTDLQPSARDAVLARAARVSPQGHAALEVAALIGGGMEPALLAKAGIDGLDADELVGAGLLVADGRAVRFRHELARLAVDASLPPNRRIEVHRTVLDALQSFGCDDDARLVYHADGAGDTALVRRFAPRAAARAASLGAHREATAQYRLALRHADPADLWSVAELNDALSIELTHLDHWEEAADARLVSLDIWRRLDEPLRVGDGLRRLAIGMWRLCRGADSVRYSAEAVAVLAPLGPSPELGWAYANRGADARDLESKAADLRRARDLAIELDQPDLLGRVLVGEGEMAFLAGGDWERPLRDAIALGARCGHDLIAASAHSNLHEFLVVTFQLAAGAAEYERSIGFCDDRELATYSSCLRGRRALSLAESGDWDEAMALAHEVLASTASPVNLLTSQVATAQVRMRRGEPGVDDVLLPAVEAARTLGETPWIVLTRLARAEHCWLAGDDDGARREVEVARATLQPRFAAESAEVARWDRRLDGASGAEPEPAALWDSRGCSYRAALSLVDAGGEEALRDALGRLDALGAAATSALVRRRLRELGHRAVPSGARTSTRRHPLGLTPRQHEVLDLVCAGLTNDEIGARLFISVKTVDHHVSALLAKLGVSNRREAARAAVERGVVTA